jgi:hypothetical protein
MGASRKERPALHVLGVEAAICLALGLAGDGAASFAPSLALPLIALCFVIAAVWALITLAGAILTALRREWKRSAWLLAKNLVLLPFAAGVGLSGGAYVHLLLRLPVYLPQISAHPDRRLLFPWAPDQSVFYYGYRTLVYDRTPVRPHCPRDSVAHLVWHFYLITGADPAEPCG